MSEWTPGRRVLTEADTAVWQRWCKERKRQAQRKRRAMYRRIDYYPSDEACEVIDALVRPVSGGDYSSIISMIVTEWAEARHRNTVGRSARTRGMRPE